MATLYGLQDARGSDLLIDNRLAIYWSAADPGYQDVTGSIALAAPDPGALAAAGVGYLLTPDKPASGLEPVFHAENVFINRVPGARPFAFVAPTTISAPNPRAAMAALLRRPLGPVVLEGACCTRAASPTDSVRVVKREPGDVELAVSAAAPATVTVLQSWADGWSADVDGAPAIVEPADVHFQAVKLPAGHHRVVLIYTQPGLTQGLLLALTGIALATLLTASQSLFAPWWRTKSLTA